MSKPKTSFDTMTLKELEALAARMATAAATIRDALALMGGPAQVAQSAPVLANAAPARAHVAPAAAAPVATAPAADGPELINGLPSLLAVDDSELSEAELRRKKEQLFRTGPPPKVRLSPEEQAKRAALLADLKAAREEAARAAAESPDAEGEEALQ